MRLNPANGKVDIEELLTYKTQLHGLACQQTETHVPQTNKKRQHKQKKNTKNKKP